MRLFGTDGIRLLSEQFFCDRLAWRVGRALGEVLMRSTDSPTVLIGRDTRESGIRIENELASGLAAAGTTAFSLGIAPTPAVAYLTGRHGFTVGISISASHNGAEYNGIKIIGNDSRKISDRDEDEIEALISRFEGGATTVCAADASALLADYRMHVMDAAGDLSGIKIALDCANGAAYNEARAIFSALGCDCICIGCEPSGDNINQGLGSTCPDTLCRTVIENECAAGFAFDGDADRCIAADECGVVRDGDYELAVLAEHLLLRGDMGDTVVGTVMTNSGLAARLSELGLKLERAAVGDKYVSELMDKLDSRLGGESSGHIIISQYASTGDGILTAAIILRAMRDSGKRLSQLCSRLKLRPQICADITADIDEKERFATLPEVQELIDEAQAAIGRGRILVRPSGTEAKIRIMAEGEDEDFTRTVAEGLAQRIRRIIAK